jgi:hypothetical protein
MAPDEPTCGDDIVLGSPASFEDCLDYFLDAIQKKPTSPLLAPPARPTVQPTLSEAPKHNSSRLANNKRDSNHPSWRSSSHAPLQHGGL